MSFGHRPPAELGSWLTRLARGRHPSSARPRYADARQILDPGRVERILVLKPHDQLGDFLVATPALAALRDHYPAARIVLLTRAFLADLAHAQPDVDQVLVLPRVSGPGDVLAWVRVLWAVARLRPDVAFVLNSVSRSKTADALAALSGARLVIGRSVVGDGPLPAGLPSDPLEVLDRSTGAAAPSDGVYDLDIGISAASEHQSRRVLDLVRVADATAPWQVMRLALDDRTRAVGAEALERAWRTSGPVDRASAGGTVALGWAGGPERASASGAGSDTRGPVRWIGIHPGAANPLKCWPLDRFVTLGAALASAVGEGGRLAVFDSPRERERAGAVHTGLLAHGVHAALVPPGRIGTFAGACSQLALLVCNDSGVMHIAAALGVPTVSFHSLGRPAEWAPANARAAAFYADHAIETLPVQPALEAAERLLAGAELSART